MKIETKHSCGDKVFKIQQDYKSEFVPCGFCAGTKRIKGKNGTTSHCPECHGHGGATVWGGKEWRVVGEMIIGQVRFCYTGKSKGYDPDSIFNNYGPQDENYEEEYMCQETGVGSGSIHKADTLWHRYELAQGECNKRNAKGGTR